MEAAVDCVRGPTQSLTLLLQLPFSSFKMQMYCGSSPYTLEGDLDQQSGELNSNSSLIPT